MTPQSYHIAWTIYLVAAVIFCLLAWQLSMLIPSARMRRILQLGTIVILFTPYFTLPDQDWLSPAILVTLFEIVFGDYHVGLKAAVPLLVLLGTVVAIAVLTVPNTQTTRDQQPEPHNAQEPEPNP